jgi:hypothetical protein
MTRRQKNAETFRLVLSRESSSVEDGGAAGRDGPEKYSV